MRLALGGKLIGMLVTAIALPATAQWKVPDDLAPLPREGQTCNDAGTHCVVNAKDWFRYKVAADVLATRIVQLQIELEEERAHKEKRCAIVTPGAYFIGLRGTLHAPPESLSKPD